MDENLIAIINRIDNTLANVSSEIDNQSDSICTHLIGIEDALERIAYALERKNEWENIKRPSLAKSS
jgi:archaellum component FlaC